jgi:hypothetical protein
VPDPEPAYDDVVEDVHRALKELAARAESAGLSADAGAP